MHARLTSLFLSILLAVCAALALTACGIFQVGVEGTATPAPTRTLFPPTLAVPTIPVATQTPMPGRLKPGQSVKIIRTHMLSPTNGWAVGQVESDLHDHILFTLDGGQTWQDRTPLEALLDPPPDGFAATTHFGPPGNAWVTYTGQSAQSGIPKKQIIWRTNDSGITWQPGEPLELSNLQYEHFFPSNLGFRDEQHGWMVAHLGVGMSHDYIAIFTTANGGQTWKRVVDPEKNPELMACPKTGLSFSTQTNGWLIGNCPGLMENLFFYATTDGGETWESTPILPPESQPRDLFASGKAGCGLPDLIYTSARSVLLNMSCTFYDSKRMASWLYVGKDGGTSEARLLPLPFGAFDFLSVDEGWMVGSHQLDPTASGEVYHTIDGGRNWTLVISTGWQGIPDFVDSNTGWVIAHIADKSALVFTNNGGKIWRELTPVIAKPGG